MNIWVKFLTLAGETRIVNLSFVYEIRKRNDGIDLVYEGGGIVHYDANIEDVENAIAEYYKEVGGEQKRWLNGEK